MTDKEKAIVMAHTGICMLTGDKFQIFHKYVEEIMGRPIMTHELVRLEDTIKEKSKADFIALCTDGNSFGGLKTHEIKLSVEFLEPVLFGEKRFEVRKNDRGYQKGDHIRFTVVGDTIKLARLHNEVCALEKIEYEITYVISGWGIENGYVVFGIDEIGEVGEKQESEDDKN